MTQDITVKSPIGEKSGSYRVDAKRWMGWIPLFVGYPALAYERDDCAQLPNSRLEGVGKNRLVKNLAGSFSYKDYVAFAKSKNDERKAEIVRIKSVSEEVSKLLAKNKFDDAETLIFNESKSRSATQKCDEKSWEDMRKSVVVARQLYNQANDKKHVQTLIAAGKYKDAISFCNSKNFLSEEVNNQLKQKTIEAHKKYVSEKVSQLLSENKFDDAEKLIENESKPSALIQECDKELLVYMRERVVSERWLREKNHVEALIAAGRYKDAISFCNSKNSFSEEFNSELKRKAEDAIRKSVAEKVSKLLAENKFDDAAKLVDNEYASLPTTQKCDEKSWEDMRKSVVVAHRLYNQANDKKHVQTLIAAGKYEDVFSFCNSENSLSYEDENELMNDAVKQAVKKLKDAKRLIAFWELIEESGLREEVVMKLKSLNSLSQFSTEQLVEIANTTERDDVVWSIIEIINDKNTLSSLLDKKRSVDVFKAILEKIADADLVRTKIWDSALKDELCVYVSVFGSDDECLRLIETYPNLLTYAMLEELKMKVVKEETKTAIEELKFNHLVTEISTLKLGNAVARVKAIKDESLRSKVAKAVLCKHDEFLRKAESCFSLEYLEFYPQLVSLMSSEDVKSEAQKIVESCTGKIHFEGYYVGMPLSEYYILKTYMGFGPDILDSFFFISTGGVRRIVFDRRLRYKMFEKEDGEFWSAFMRKYIPARKKKSLGDAIGDALDSGTYDYQMGYDDKLEESSCCIYKSMKYGTKVIFGTDSGTLVLEEYK